MAERLIIDAHPDHLEEAFRTLMENKARMADCKVGWGWGFSRRNGPSFFARRTKGGFSIKQTRMNP